MRVVYKKDRNSGLYCVILGNDVHQFREHNGELQSKKLCTVNGQTVGLIANMQSPKVIPVNIATATIKLLENRK